MLNKIFHSLLIVLIYLSNTPLSLAEDAFIEEEKEESSWSQTAWENMKSPVTTDAKYALLGGSALLAGVLIFEDQLIDPTQEESVEHKPLGKYSKVGDLAGQLVPNAVYTLGMLSYGYFQSDQKALLRSYNMFQSTLYAVFVTTVLKFTVREPRPTNSNERTSFPSGHTTSAFAFASYVGCRHSWPWGLAAYAMAGFVGYSRINDNRHYLHDVIAGATIGESFGLGICLLEKEREKASSEKDDFAYTWYAYPSQEGFNGGLAVVF